MSLKLDQSQLRTVSINGQQVPCEGPRVVPVALDFSLTTEYDLQLQNFEARNFISMIQGLFIDNSLSASPLSIVFENSGQTIKIAPGHQAYKAVLCPNPAFISFLSEGGTSVKVLLLNFPVTNDDWATS
jgi:hypothetical protein